MQGQIRELVTRYGPDRPDVVRLGRHDHSLGPGRAPTASSAPPSPASSSTTGWNAAKPGTTPTSSPARTPTTCTPEQEIGAYNDKQPWETCMTLGTQWSWKPNDDIKTRTRSSASWPAAPAATATCSSTSARCPTAASSRGRSRCLKKVGAWLGAVRREHLRHPRRAVQARRLWGLDAQGQHDLPARLPMDGRYASAAGHPGQGRRQPHAGRWAGASSAKRKRDRDLRGRQRPPGRGHGDRPGAGRPGEPHQRPWPCRVSAAKPPSK